ncbi:hypothetical protein [Xenorhabdus mauleonii]|uniref:hypothetical protein n=1 Tax=Xenorhabdus mauleonii TaxID=351675 RepID=UPI0030DD40B4
MGINEIYSVRLPSFGGNSLFCRMDDATFANDHIVSEQTAESERQNRFIYTGPLGEIIGGHKIPD